MKKYLLVLTAAVFLLSGCENNNIYSWTHVAGRDGSVEALLADAQKAESDGDYEKALEYYDKILSSSPDNSEALYGKASAELKNAGLNISDLVSKIISEDETGTQDLLGSLDFKKLLAGSKEAKEALAKIADGQADGTIPADNTDVNLNLAIVRVVYVASYLIENCDIEVKDDFSLDTSSAAINDTDKQILTSELEKAIANLKVAGMDTADMEKDFEQLKTDINNL